MPTVNARPFKEPDMAMMVKIFLANRAACKKVDSVATPVINSKAPLYQIRKNGNYFYLQGREVAVSELKKLELEDNLNILSSDILANFLDETLEVARVPVGFYNTEVAPVTAINNVIRRENLCYIFGKRTQKKELKKHFPEGIGRGSIIIRI